MTELSGWEYLAVFASTAAITLGLTPLALRIAINRRIFDHPGEIKSQESPVPYLGGVAIVLSFALVVAGATLIRPPVSGSSEILVILGLGVGLSIIGLVDDLRGLSPWPRLIAELAAGVIVWATPAHADVFDQDILNLVVTVLWIAGVTNALNLLDNMDGLSAGVAGIAAFFLFVIAVDNGQFLVATLAASLGGCAVAFLRSNFHPARIYMGDAGALFLGFMLAVLGLKLRFPDVQRDLSLAVPILVCAVPLFDTALVTINRVRHHRSPLRGGQDHTSHRLVFVGIPVRATVLLIYLGSVTAGVLAFVLSRVDRTTGLVAGGWTLVVGLALGALLSTVPVYDTSRRRHLMLQEVLPHEEPPSAAGDAEAS